VQRPS